MLRLFKKPDLAEDTDVLIGIYASNVSHLIAENTKLGKKMEIQETLLRATRTAASKNGCWALLAFGLIAIEILGLAIYFLPR